MEALSEWIVEVGKLVMYLGIIKLGYNWLWRAFNGNGKIF